MLFISIQFYNICEWCKPCTGHTNTHQQPPHIYFLCMCRYNMRLLHMFAYNIRMQREGGRYLGWWLPKIWRTMAMLELLLFMLISIFIVECYRLVCMCKQIRTQMYLEMSHVFEPYVIVWDPRGSVGLYMCLHICNDAFVLALLVHCRHVAGEK